jgi:hypothetical protein
MPSLPKKKVGIVACSGEELAEGTVTRLAALDVLERLRPGDTVTICLPLFLAGGKGDRAFARFYPTVAIDGCAKKCAARATEMYSGRPAASVVVTDIAQEHGIGPIEGRRRLNEAGRRAVSATAGRIAEYVDDLLDAPREHPDSAPRQAAPGPGAPGSAGATCACGSGIPVSDVEIGEKTVTLAALPLIFEQFRLAGKAPGDATATELLEIVRIYNQVPQGAEQAYASAVLREYAAFLVEKGKTS